MSILSNFSTMAAFGRKALTVVASVAITIGVMSGTDAGTLLQGYDNFTAGVIGLGGGAGLFASILMTYFSKQKPATVPELKAVAAKSDIAIRVMNGPANR